MVIDSETKRAFLRLASELSPENLTADGELSPAEVQARHRELKARWHSLEREVGFKVGEETVWQWLGDVWPAAVR